MKYTVLTTITLLSLKCFVHASESSLVDTALEELPEHFVYVTDPDHDSSWANEVSSSADTDELSERDKSEIDDEFHSEDESGDQYSPLTKSNLDINNVLHSKHHWRHLPSKPLLVKEPSNMTSETFNTVEIG